MKHIRPYQFFGEETGRTAQISIPHRRAAGSLMLLETMCLIGGLKHVNARTVFEFGTFLGATTLNLAMNIPEKGKGLYIRPRAGAGRRTTSRGCPVD